MVALAALFVAALAVAWGSFVLLRREKKARVRAGLPPDRQTLSEVVLKDAGPPAAPRNRPPTGR